MDMDLTNALMNLGLTSKEAAIYLALLKLGEGSAYEVSKTSGLKRPTAYVILDELVERRIIRKILHPKAVHYAANDPVELFVSTRHKVEQAEQALPELRALAQTEAKTVKAEYYEGISGIREMYEKLLRNGKTKDYIGFFAHERDTSQELTDYWTELNSEFVKRKISRRGITSKDPSIDQYITYQAVPKDLIQLKALPLKMYDSNISIEVYDQSTQILSHRHMQGIVIQNPDIANVVRQIFEIVWKTVPSTTT